MAVRRRFTRGRGRHFLRSSKLAAELVRAAGIRRGDLVLDLGAGTGVLTAALARRTSRVVAIEIDPELAAGLRRRFEIDIRVADALRVPLPSEPFKVVANLPFDGATAILRRLLDPRVPLVSADVIVDWRFACKRAAVWPSTQLSAFWGAWFELSVVRRLPRCLFAPPRLSTRACSVSPAARSNVFPCPKPESTPDFWHVVTARGFETSCRGGASSASRPSSASTGTRGRATSTRDSGLRSTDDRASAG